jgi:hypothetical protein
MKVKLSNTNCQINITEKVDTILFQNKIAQKDSDLILKHIENLSSINKDKLKTILKEGDSEEDFNKSKLKQFLITHGFPIIHGLSSSALYNLICKLI